MLPVIKTILYSTDLGPYGPKVFRHAAGLAQQYGAKLVLLHALEPLSENSSSVINSFLPQGSASIESMRQQGMERLRAQLHQRLERFYQENLPAGHHGEWEIRISEGSSAPVILAEAKAAGADLIVMGTHGHSTLGEIVLGSVAHKVIHRSTIPVLMVPIREH